MRLLASIAAAFLAGFAVTRWIVPPLPAGVAAASPDSMPKHAVDASKGPDAGAAPLASTISATPPTNHLTIQDALKGDDPLASAARVLAWIETADAETFRRLAEDPKKFPTPYFSGFGREFQDAFCAALAEHWLTLDPEGALAAMRRVDEKVQFSYGPGGLLYSLARLRPELVLESPQAKNPSNPLPIYIHEALKTLAARDLKAAQRFAEQWKEPESSERARNAIIQGVAESDPLAAIALAKDSKEPSQFFWQIVNAAAKRGPLTFQQVTQAAGERLSPYSISPDLVLQYPELVDVMPNLPPPKGGFSLSRDALDAAERLAPEERERLLASYETLPISQRPVVAAALACAWVRTEPRAAADWALAHAKPDDGENSENTAAQQVFLRWINNDADAALGWWRALPDSPLRATIGTNASSYLAEEGRLEEALEIFKPAPDAKEEAPSKTPGAMTMGGGSPEERATEHLAQILAEHDPATAGAWFAKLPASVATYQTTRAFLPKWYARDPEAVARWIETLPAGAPRDEATRTFIQEATRLSPAGASEWVATVADHDLRQSAAAMVYQQMWREDPAGANRWLSELNGVDEVWRGGMLRR